MEASRACFMAESSRAGKAQYKEKLSMGMAKSNERLTKSIMVAGTVQHGARMVQNGGGHSPAWRLAKSGMVTDIAQYSGWLYGKFSMVVGTVQHGGWHSPVWWMALWRSPTWLVSWQSSAWLASWKYPVGLASVRSPAVSWERVARWGPIFKMEWHSEVQ